MLKKLLSILLTLCMVMTLLPVTAAAETLEAGGTEAEFKTAIDSAAAGDTVRLTSDITLTSIVTISKIVTLDLNGYTITGPSDTYTLSVNGVGNLTITDTSFSEDGKITAEDNYAVISNRGELNINGGTIIGSSGYALLNTSAKPVTISGGILESIYTSTIYMSGTGGLIVSGDAIITNDTITSAIVIWSGESNQTIVDIQGGKVINTGIGSAIFHGSAGKLKISGGTVTSKATNASSYESTIRLYEGSSSDTVLEITGGTVENTAGRYAVYNMVSGNVIISDEATISGKLYPLTQTPEVQSAAMYKSATTDPDVDFTLTNSTAYADSCAWVVYSDSNGTAIADGVTASKTGDTLTLTHSSDIPAADYYVAVSDRASGKGESERLKLTVNSGVPDAPTFLTATAGSGMVTVSFTPPASEGGAAITHYTVTAYFSDGSEAGITASGNESPIIITGLTNGMPYKFNVTATNSIGTSQPSEMSGSITPWPEMAPKATVQTITGTLRVGQTLTGHYTYSDVNGDLEGESIYRWYRSDNYSGLNIAEIAEANSITYVLQPEDIGKYISFEVTPVAATGTALGTAVESAKVGPVSATISIAAIPDVTAPVAGAVPVTNINTGQYSAAITWSPSDSPFKGSKVYTATITITPKPGFTLTGVPENFFSVSGAVATNAAGSGVVTAVFPETAPAVISISSITGITAPAAGAVPDTTVNEIEQYSATITWSPNNSPFKGETVYTATITITPKPSFTLTGVPENFFSVAGASTTNAANSGVVTAVFPETAPAVISLSSITGITAPATGAVPDTTVNETEQYSASITWSPNDSPFKGETVYTATITITPKPGFTLTGVPENFFSVAGASTTNAANSGVVTAVFPETAPAVISKSSITGITAPAAGAVPDTTVNETEQYSASITWSPNDSPFKGSKVYTATITITPKTGFTLTGVPADFFTVSGATATNTADSGVVTAVFPETAPAVISISSITGLTAPVTGAVPDTTVDETEEYTATITWSPNDAAFKGETVYTATITITPKTGFTLTGVTADFFTVAGAIATNAADSGVVTAVFPETDPAVISISEIPGVTIPVTGAEPDTTVEDTSEYTATITWTPNDSPFKGETVYTATITITPKTGFTLTGVPADFFTVEGSTATNAAGSGVVTAVFPETDPAAISISAITGLTAPVTGAVPDTTVDETEEYTATITWTPNDSPFKGETVYTATITITPKTGFTLTGVTADFFTVAGAIATNAADSGVVTAVFPETDPAVISISAITGLTAPVTGAVPDTTVDETEEYTATITWSPNDEAFKGETVYTATITITPKTGFTLTGVSANFFTVAGAIATNAVDSGVVTAIFPETAPAVISLSAITGITAPVTGAVPDTTVDETEEFTATVSWSPNDATFKGETVYTATITITPKPGFTLTGVPANFFTAAGAVTTNTAGSGVVSAIFPQTAPLTYTVTFDVNGGSPVEAISNITYGSTITSPTAPVKSGYTFAGWYKEPELINEWDFASDAVTEDITLYAKWTPEIPAPPPGGGSGGGGTPPAAPTEIDSGETLTYSSLDQLISEDKTLTVKADNGAMLVFDTDSLKGISSQTSGDIKVEIKDVSHTYQEDLSGKLVFSLTVISGNSIITNFSGAVTVSLPYELKEGERAEDVTVWHLADDGTMTEIPCVYDPVTKLATFTVTHFSNYVVGVADSELWVNPFSDVQKSDWFYGAVEFANRNGLFSGTGASTFSPGRPMTRAMLWTVLGRLDGQDLSGSDVYALARSWAMSAGITDGTDPDGSITREQMITILWRYAGSPMAGGDLSRFSDAGKVSDYAAEAMAWAVKNGIIEGADGALMPGSSATRAQVAAILQRFIALIA